MSKYDIFISYRRSNGLEMARMLNLQLTNMGVRNFLDLEEIHTGQFNEKIYESIDDAAYVVFIMSEGALDRCVNPDDWVRKELEYAYKKGKKVIPVKWIGTKLSYPDKLPRRLETIRTSQAKEIDQGPAFKDTVLKLVRECMPDVQVDDDPKKKTAEEKKKTAEETLLSRARRYKNDDYVIDRKERADLEKLARELGIDAITREAIIEKVENEKTDASDSVSRKSLPAMATENVFELFISTVRNSFDYHGFSGRKEYWIYLMGCLLGELVAFLFDAMFFDEPITMFLMLLALTIPFAALAGRRARDCGFSGWLAATCFIPFVGWFSILFLGIRGGKFA